MKKENWDLVGASCYADLNHRQTAFLCRFQDRKTCAKNLIEKNQQQQQQQQQQLHIKNLKALKQVQEKKLVGSCWRTEIIKVKGQFFPVCCVFVAPKFLAPTSEND